MRCPIETQESAELLLAYCARRLDPETTIALDRHMAICPACRALRDGQQAVWTALDSWQAAPVSADFDQRLYHRIDAEVNSSWWARISRPLRPVLLRQGLPLAAATCLMVVAGVLLERPRDVAVPDPVQAEAVQVDQVEQTLNDLEILRQLTISPQGDTGNLNSM